MNASTPTTPPARRRTTSLKRVFRQSVSLLIVLPLVPLVLSTWHDYTGEVRRLEEQLQESNHQVAVLAGRLLESMLEEAAHLLRSQPFVPSQPLPPLFAAWEQVGADGLIRSSSLAADRVGRPFETDGDWLRVLGHGGLGFDLSSVRRLAGLAHPTVLVRVAVDHGAPEDAFRIGFVDPLFLRDRLLAYVESPAHRHVYALDWAGAPVFHKSIEMIDEPSLLEKNPPVLIFRAGEEGSLRYVSALSKKERIGTVLRLPRTHWGLVVSADIASRLVDVRSRFLWVAASLILAGGLAALVLIYFSRRILEPLVGIAREIRRLSRDKGAEFSVPSSVRRIREYDQLVGVLEDHIATTRKAEAKSVQAEKLATLGELTAGLAHEIGTPLNVMRGSAQLLLRKFDPADPNRSALEKIVQQTSRIADLIRSLLDLARSDQSKPEPFGVAGVLSRALDGIAAMYPGLELRREIPRDLPPIVGFPRPLEHVFLNLFVNAGQAMEGKGALIVRAALEQAGDERRLRVTVQDTGPGIQPEHLPKIFQPFFSTKGSGKGTGLGLAYVDRVVKEHNGSIDVASRPGEGARFDVLLPAAEPPREPEEKENP
ncbi:MAG: hypothetical protein C4523_19770 [Myxococcales bacterium]|nr:MAG: hypothetical protein C4523_19770 [Myxococcales bacterium]